MKIFKTKIHKMGPKLGMYFPNHIWKNLNRLKGKCIQLTIKKGNREIISLTRMNQIISLRNSVVRDLKISHKDIVEIKIKPVNNLKRSNEIFKGNKYPTLQAAGYLEVHYFHLL